MPASEQRSPHWPRYVEAYSTWVKSLMSFVVGSSWQIHCTAQGRKQVSSSRQREPKSGSVKVRVLEGAHGYFLRTLQQLHAAGGVCLLDNLSHLQILKPNSPLTRASYDTLYNPHIWSFDHGSHGTLLPSPSFKTWSTLTPCTTPVPRPTQATWFTDTWRSS